MPSTSMRDACFTSSGLPWADSGSPTGYYAISDYAWSVSDCTLCTASPATQASMGDCGPWGGAGEELLGATPFGAAGRRPNRGCWQRATAGAAWHNVTKLHGPQTYWDAGRERASGAASQSMCQARASTSRCHWLRTWKESWAARGQEEQVQSRGLITPTSDMAELTVSPFIVTVWTSSSGCMQL